MEIGMQRDIMLSTGAYEKFMSTPSSMNDPCSHVLELSLILPRNYPGNYPETKKKPVWPGEWWGIREFLYYPSEELVGNLPVIIILLTIPREFPGKLPMINF